MVRNDGWYTTLVELFERAVDKFSDNRLFGTKNAQGEYEWITYKELGVRVDNVRSGLKGLGLGKGDAVGGIFNNCVEYAAICFATYGLGGRWIPMYLKERSQIWKYIINDAEIKALFVNDKEIYDKIMEFKDECPSLQHIFIVKAESSDPLSMEFLENQGAKNPVDSFNPNTEDIAVLIYTSGTTGDPKGVLLSHGNIVSNIEAGYNAFHENLREDSIAFSILPWAHSYAYTAELNNIMQVGGSLGLMDKIETLIDDLPKIAPTAFIAVPKVFNKIYSGLHKKMEDAGGIKLKLFNKAKELATKKRKTGKDSFMLKILDKLVFGKIRAAFGGRLEFSLTSSALMNIEICEFFDDIGIPVYDAYGMTELSPAATVNSPIVGWKMGSVGKALENVTIKIDKSRVGEDSKDGEIIVYGPNVMKGYHNKPEKTAEVITSDGGMKTGDRGWMDEDGFLYITGRFKEEYKLINGKYVHPASIEEELRLLPYVANAYVYGDGRPNNVALIFPDFETLNDYSKTIQLSAASNFKEFIKSKAVRELLSKEMQAHLSKTFGGYEIPRKFWYITQDFTVENGLLTQTMKLKRTKVFEKYKDILENLFELPTPKGMGFEG